MSPNQRSKKRNSMIGVYVEPNVKVEVERIARSKGLTMADYVRTLLVNENKKNDENQTLFQTEIHPV